MDAHRKSESGQALVLLVLALIGLLGFTAMAIDGGLIFSDRRSAQNAADTAALAGALAKIENRNWRQAALDRASSNHYVAGGQTTDVRVFSPPLNGPYTGNSEYLQVIIDSRVNTSFAHFVFGGPVINTVESVARAKPGLVGPIYPGQAIVGLAPTGCSVVWTHGSAKSKIEGGGIFVNSSDPNCAFQLSGGAGSLTVPSLTVVGGAAGSPSLANVYVPPGAFTVGYRPQYPYPPTFEPALPLCQHNATVSGNTMSDGKWVGKFPPNGVTKLNPGIYCVSGDFRLNGGASLEGSDVLIYMESGDISWNGGAKVKLYAKDTGQKSAGEYPYDGMLIYANPKQYVNVTNCTVTLNGNSQSQIVGTVYAPTCKVALLGTGGTNAFQAKVVGYTVEMGGTEDLYLQYNENMDPALYDPATGELVQ